MKELTNTDMGRLEVSVRMTEHLAAKGKSHPEKQAVQYIERAFKRLNIPYRVVWDLPPVEGISPPEEGKGQQLSEFSDKLNAEDPIPGVCKDSNILLTDRRGGGVAYAKMKGAVAPGAIYEDRELAEWVTPDDDRHCFFGMLHELAHNIGKRGGSHRQSAGRVWQEPDEEAWYRTPTGTPNDTNLCGEQNDPKEQSYQKRDCLYFADCMREWLLIRPE